MPDLVLMSWGLVPFWAKDGAVVYKMINAPAETIAEKPGAIDQPLAFAGRWES